MYTYVGRKGRAVHDGRRFEVQIRTQLQHAWATTVEAVGLFRGEQLKNHQGSAECLRFFELISGELAEAESCPVPESVLESPTVIGKSTTWPPRRARCNCLKA